MKKYNEKIYEYFSTKLSQNKIIEGCSKIPFSQQII